MKIMMNHNMIHENIKNYNIKFAHIPPIKMIVRDSQQMMWVFVKFRENGSPTPETAIGV
ncbi:MAG: hypothetical protein H5T36_03710 [Methanobacteriaceae archaeon]|nr:hypothetical protein [Methanobacteriaceae archaeon]